jgi:hypothetical protein
MKIKIIQQKISQRHNDSVWYEGEIATAITKKGTKLSLLACGDILIKNKKGEIVYDGKERNEGIKRGFNSDKDLKKIGQNYTDNYYWENNNWFEVAYMEKGCGWDTIIGEVAYTYDDAIQLLKDYGEEY